MKISLNTASYISYLIMSIIIEDQTEELTLLHYQGVNEETDTSIKQTRGHILNEEKEVVCSSYGYTQEYTVEQRDLFESLLGDVTTCSFFRAEEGTLLRLFFYDNQWYLSTFKRINAFESRWSSSKTFGELFLDALTYFFKDGNGKNTLQFEQGDVFNVFCNTLDRTLVYTFLLRTNEQTKIVCRPPMHPTVFFSGCFKDGVRLLENKTSLMMPEALTFTTVDELCEYITTVDPEEHQGVIAMLPDQTTLKIVHPLNMTYKTIRGSEPDIEQAYLRVRSTEDRGRFLMLFPQINTDFIELKLENMVKYLHRMYIRRFIKKLYTILHPTLFFIMRKAHTWHTLDRATNIVTLDRMKSLVEEQSSSSLYRMYQEFNLIV